MGKGSVSGKSEGTNAKFTINGGTFNSTGSETVSDENYNSGFISGGIYTHNVTDYIEDEYREKDRFNKVEVLKKVVITNDDNDASYTASVAFVGFSLLMIIYLSKNIIIKNKI